MRNTRIVKWLGCAAFAVLPAFSAAAKDLAALPNTIEKIKPAIVAVGTYQNRRRPAALFRGTRFVIANGLHIVINAPVLPEKIDIERTETSPGVPAEQTSSTCAKRQRLPKIRLMTSRSCALLDGRYSL